MKTILLVILLCSSVCYSQRLKPTYYGSIGAGLAFPQAGGLNDIIDLHNSSPNIVEKMDKFETFFGLNFLFGINLKGEKSYANFEFGFSFNYSGKKSSEILISGVRTVQDIAVRFPLINTSAGYFLRLGKSFDIGAGCAFNLGSYNILYRQYVNLASPPDYININNDNLLSDAGITPTLFINWRISKKIALSLRPGYYAMLSKQDLTGLNLLLNGAVSSGKFESVSHSGPTIILNMLIALNNTFL